MSTATLDPEIVVEETVQAEVWPRPHRWTREEYYKMAEAGFFEGKRVELIFGEVIEMSPMGRPHVMAVKFGARTLEKAFGKGWFVQTQAPLDLGLESDPEPDIAVIAGDDRDYLDTHPDTAALVVEVAESTLKADRKVKGSLYAGAGIEDYWVVNLNKRQLEVYRRPIVDKSAPSGFIYGNMQILNEEDSVSPLAKPKAVIRVADLLP
ncbi:MAG: Uma2 family endonuclease [Blastocatellia bacterium]